VIIFAMDGAPSASCSTATILAQLSSSRMPVRAPSTSSTCDGCGSQWDRKQTAPVGSFRPNALGLYDMHGNVWEWVEDSWHDNYDGAPTDGSAWLRGGDPSYRVIRGGSWRNDTEFIRAAVRVKRNINVQFDTLGFRVARSLNR
jgi:formylglycine-generating enzyme required for sulfatase activity